MVLARATRLADPFQTFKEKGGRAKRTESCGAAHHQQDDARPRIRFTTAAISDISCRHEISLASLRARALMCDFSSPQMWKCPACQTPLQHSDKMQAPRPGV